MKNLIFAMSLLFLALLACKKEDTIICGVDDPATELSWLAEIIALAETDTTGNYLGTVYLEYYKNNPIFFTDMKMGSGGVIGNWFNCDGSTFIIEDINEFQTFSNNMRLDKIIYTNNNLK